MKKSLALLATFAFSSAVLYAMETYDRETVLSLFEQYNPAVLQNAQQDPAYKMVLEKVVDAYNLPKSDETLFALIALIRNYDNSLELSALTEEYERAFILNYTNGLNTQIITDEFEKNLAPVFSRIWASTLQVHNLHLDQYKQQLKQAKKATFSSQEEKQAVVADLKERIAALKKEIKTLKKDPGQLLAFSVHDYTSKIQQEMLQQLQLAIEAAQQAKDVRAAETENLQITSNNKKPVAK